jgi:hypothetical protein
LQRGSYEFAAHLIATESARIGSNPASHVLPARDHGVDTWDSKSPIVFTLSQPRKHSVIPCSAEQISPKQPSPAAKYCFVRDARYRAEIVEDNFFKPFVSCHGCSIYCESDIRIGVTAGA